MYNQVLIYHRSGQLRRPAVHKQRRGSGARWPTGCVSISFVIDFETILFFQVSGCSTAALLRELATFTRTRNGSAWRPIDGTLPRRGSPTGRPSSSAARFTLDGPMTTTPTILPTSFIQQNLSKATMVCFFAESCRSHLIFADYRASHTLPVLCRHAPAQHGKRLVDVFVMAG